MYDDHGLASVSVFQPWPIKQCVLELYGYSYSAAAADPSTSISKNVKITTEFRHPVVASQPSYGHLAGPVPAHHVEVVLEITFDLI